MNKFNLVLCFVWIGWATAAAVFAVMGYRMLRMRHVFAKCGHLAHLRPDNKGGYEQRFTLRIAANEKKKIVLKPDSDGVPKYCHRCYAKSQGWARWVS